MYQNTDELASLHSEIRPHSAESTTFYATSKSPILQTSNGAEAFYRIFSMRSASRADRARKVGIGSIMDTAESQRSRSAYVLDFVEKVVYIAIRDMQKFVD